VPHKKNNVLLVNITRLGDMLQATPTIVGIKEENPHAKITVLVEQQFAEVCQSIPAIDEVIGLDLSMVVRALHQEGEGIIDAYRYVDEFIERLKTYKFDFCLNMSSSAYTALLLNLLDIPYNGGWKADAEGYRRIESEWARLFASSVFHQNRQFNSLNLVDIFRCSAQVDAHPRRLVVEVTPEARKWVVQKMREAPWSSEDGPLIALQAGASQIKRQWEPQLFAVLIRLLCDSLNARVVLIGSSKERTLTHKIVQLSERSRVWNLAGQTSIPFLSAILEKSNILITGDTGPMHLSVAVGTPVVAMFLASAFGFETGPYSEGNIVVQPIIGCGPCNPNKECARPDCHETVSPSLIAHLTALRLKGDFFEVSPEVLQGASVTVYRSTFDEYGFCDLVPMHRSSDAYTAPRSAYRKLWLDELAHVQPQEVTTRKLPLATMDEGFKTLSQCAEKGQVLIRDLIEVIKDERLPPCRLGELNVELSELDRVIETEGFRIGMLGPLVRMFVFEKENLEGADPVALASQMGRAYATLSRRCAKLSRYLNQ
jgi:ADP-heptose:LPS heptosyltransferase